MNEQTDYDNITELDWVLYEFATIAYDYKIHPEAVRRINELFERLVKDGE